MKEKIKNESIYLAVTLFLSCYFMQLCNFQMIWMLAGCGIICIYFVINQKVIRIDVGICLLAITMYSFYIIQYGVRAVITMIPYVPMVMYVMANYLAGDIKKDQHWERKFVVILFTLIVGYTIHGVLNSYMYYAGYIKEGTRQWHDIWTRSYMPGTQHSLFYLPMIAMLFPAIIWFRKQKLVSTILIICSMFFIYTSLITKSRIPIMIFAMIICGELVLYFFLESKKIKKMFSNLKTWIGIGVFLVVIVVSCYFLKDVAVVKSFIDNLSRGGGIFNNVRFVLQAKAIEQLFEYPMGGRLMDLTVDYQHRYIHNVWLDMANASGLIPFFAFVLFSIFSIVNLIRFLVKEDISSKTKIITAGLYTSFILFYFVEPALDASIHYLSPWMLLNGLIQGILARDTFMISFKRRTNEK